jgi:hypothetical protein
MLSRGEMQPRSFDSAHDDGDILVSKRAFVYA